MAKKLTAIPEKGPERINGKLTTWGKFVQHRRDSKWRGIPFLLSLEEWCQIWNDSGRFAQRGPLKGQYVMARFNDDGPYAVGNVKIIESGENHKEGNIGRKHVRSPETCLRLSEAHKGKTLSEEHKKRIGAGVRKAVASRPPLVLSEETRKRISEARRRIGGFPHTEETRRKLSDLAKARWEKRRREQHG